jgi:hypothetical protein
MRLARWQIIVKSPRCTIKAVLLKLSSDEDQGSKRSQEVKLLVKRGCIQLALLTSTLLSLVHFVGLFLTLFVHTSQAYARVELGNLVSILARSRHFNGPSPVVVEVAQGECQVFQVDLPDFRLVLSYVEVSR